MATTTPAWPHLLGIPYELRNQIYNLIFPTNCGPERLKVLLTCKQVHNEACVLAFGRINFNYFDLLGWQCRDGNIVLRRKCAPTYAATVQTVTIEQDESLTLPPLLFSNKIHPSKLYIKTHPRLRQHLVTLKDLPGFAIPSVALMKANPNLTNIEFLIPKRTGRYSADFDHEANYLTEEIKKLGRDTDDVFVEEKRACIYATMVMDDGEYRALKIEFRHYTWTPDFENVRQDFHDQGRIGIIFVEGHELPIDGYAR